MFRLTTRSALGFLHAEPVQVSKASTENMHYGWLFESFGSGAFDAGCDVLFSGILLVERLTAKAALGTGKGE